MRADRDPAIHHVQTAMPAGAEADARRFYGELLGLREIEKPEGLRSRGGVWFRSGTLQLHLGVDPEFAPATKAHVAFKVADLDTVRQRCRAAGHPVREDSELPGYQRFYTDDPFGNRVEILQPIDVRSSLDDVPRDGLDVGEFDLPRDRGPMRDIDRS